MLLLFSYLIGIVAEKMGLLEEWWLEIGFLMCGLDGIKIVKGYSRMLGVYSNGIWGHVK